MGCGLRKLEEPEDSSPGKIYSSLKRPQVETRTDSAYEYVLLDFSLEGSSRPSVQCLSSLCELPGALQPHYREGFQLAALHPIILSVGRSRPLPLSLLYRAVLARPHTSKQAGPRAAGAPQLLVEEWPLPGDALTSDSVTELIDRVNRSARLGVRFLGSVLQQGGGGGRSCNGGASSPRGGSRSPAHARLGEGGLEEDGPACSQDLRLLVLLHSWAPGLGSPPALPCSYHQGALSMRVSRKGQTVSALEADWLELTAAYYRKGWSLVDSFVYWDTPRGEPVPRSLEGLFVYEEPGPSLTPPVANDTIVVEQWTVIEGSEVKADYGPLIHTLAEFGWLLTCVLPTPIIRHDSEGNLATKQVVFLQRPVRCSEPPPRRPQAGSPCSEASAQPMSPGDGALQAEDLSPCSGVTGGFPGFGGGYPSVLTELEEGGFEQDEGVAQVTCM
ncbi:raftlin-2 [Lepisosteus oculatus]|uniref:raftlin-2 n=1 Tax=Lepisosteus oculatus TaxID=7918 RepID=UPI0035F52452